MANILSLNYPIKLMELYKLFISIFNICPKVFGDKLREVALTDKPQYKKTQDQLTDCSKTSLLRDDNKYFKL